MAGGPVVQPVEAAGYVPTRDYQARKALDIRCRIDIFTNEYQGRNLLQWRQQLATKRQGQR